MTNQHPLTDEMLQQIDAEEKLWRDQHPLTNRICHQITWDVRCKISDEDDMRAAADWQLEKDAEYFAQYLVKNFGLAPEVAELRAEWFKEAMRPQQQEGN